MGWHITEVSELEDAIIKLKLRLARKIGASAGLTIIDIGCGQGGFTTCLAKIVGKQGKVFAVDISDEYLAEFTARLNEHGVKNLVTFIQADAVNLKEFIHNDVADVVGSYRLLEELKQPEAMAKIVKEMARIARRGGKVGIVELCTETRNQAEETYVRLHRESGDSLFEPDEIIEAMKGAKLADINMEKVETNIWFSPELAKQDLSHAQVWYDANVEKSLGALIDRHGMKYPEFLIFSGTKKALEGSLLHQHSNRQSIS